MRPLDHSVILSSLLVGFGGHSRRSTVNEVGSRARNHGGLDADIADAVPNYLEKFICVERWTGP